MTLWNPLNVFGNSQRRAAGASFDPSRTGDPVQPQVGRPAIGFGETGIGTPAEVGESRRHPIGFAPWDEDREQTYVTEFSFKRHHDAPRASVTPDRPITGDEQSWQTPDTGDAVVDGATDVSSGAESAEVAEAKVPFYKREIGFGRKRSASEQTLDEVAGDDLVLAADSERADEVVAEQVTEPDLESEPELVEVVSELDASSEADAPELEDDVSAADDAASSKVPFYKREIGFGRRRSSSEETPDEAASDDVESHVTGLTDLEMGDDPVGESVDEGVASGDDLALDVDSERADEVVAEQVTEPDPEPDLVDVVSELDASSEADAPELEDGVSAADDAASAKVPFYKREISLRRKAAPSEEAANPAPVGDLSPADHHDEEIMGVVAADAPEVVENVASTEVTSESSVDADAHDLVDLDSADEDDGPIISGSPDEVPPAGAAPDVDADPVEFDLPAADADVDRVATPEDAEIVPVGAGDVLPESETPMEPDDLFVEDTPPVKGRFSSRKAKSTEKAPKRKASRGGGAKGRRVVGLKIGASQIAAAVVVESDGRHELVQLTRRPLAAGIVVDGEVKDVDALANALKAFFEEEKLPRKDVRVGLASNRIGVRTFDIVGIDDEARFDNAVRFKAHEVLPVAAHESVLDYRVLEERPNEAGEPTRRVLLVVAPRDQVEPYAEVARRAGIKLSGIDLEALGLLRAFVEPKPFAVRAVDDTATVVVAMGHESSTLLVAGGGACEFTRVFDWGGQALVSAIADSLEVHPAEAATILKHLSLSGPGAHLDSLDDAARARAVDAVRLALTPFARELVASLQFYQTQDESLGIGGIVITGGTSHLEGLADALNQMIGVSVAVGDPLGRVTPPLDIDPAVDSAIGSMAVPIGLAIDDLAMRAVDLLPKDAVKTKSRRSTLIAVGAPIAVAVPLVALGFLYLGAHGQVADNEAELAAVKADIAALPTPTGPDIDSSVVGDEAVRATAVASVLGGRLAWDAVFRDMARVLPSNVWFQSLSVTQPEAGNAADAAVAGSSTEPPSAVVIDGYTYTQTDVARLLARLATLPSLKTVTLTSSKKEIVGKKEVVHFGIAADLNQNGGAS